MIKGCSSKFNIRNCDTEIHTSGIDSLDLVVNCATSEKYWKCQLREYYNHTNYDNKISYRINNMINLCPFLCQTNGCWMFDFAANAFLNVFLKFYFQKAKVTCQKFPVG